MPARGMVVHADQPQGGTNRRNLVKPPISLQSKPRIQEPNTMHQHSDHYCFKKQTPTSYARYNDGAVGLVIILYCRPDPDKQHAHAQSASSTCTWLQAGNPSPQSGRCRATWRDTIDEKKASKSFEKAMPNSE